MLGGILGPFLTTGPLPQSVAISEQAQIENPRLPLAFKCLHAPIEIIHPTADTARLQTAGIYFRAYHETSVPRGLSAQTQVVALHGNNNWQIFFALLRWSRERTIEAQIAQRDALAKRADSPGSGPISNMSDEAIVKLLKRF